jgi:hypothetical protein
MTDKFISDHHRAAIMQELLLGPGANLGSAFVDREELQAAWEEHRAELMAMTKPGQRPLAWWEFECPSGVKFNVEHEASVLWRAGVVTGEERLDLEAEWKKKFEQAFTRGYDARRRKEHFRWADIPRELVEAWTAERKRSAKTIRKLETGEPAQEEAPAADPEGTATRA